jgi:ribosomal protein S18 acetylase RimI-like enzyme
MVDGPAVEKSERIFSVHDVVVRPFRPTDQSACAKLYTDGLLGGKLAENDTGVDIDDIQSAYMNQGSNFWVAQVPGNVVVGTVGVMQIEQDVAEIRRLRVHNDVRRKGIGSKLLESAIEFCREQHYLKITLDTFIDREPAIKLFEKFQFRHTRSRDVQGKTLSYFYLDLYGREKE